MKGLPEDYSLKMPQKLKTKLESLPEEKFNEFLKKLNINFDGKFTKEEKLNLLKNQGQNKLIRVLKQIQ